MSFKRIAGSSSERYRLLISDGMYSNSYAMLATQLNKMVTDSTLDEFCVIKVKRLQCNTMQGKKVIIILDMEVLRPGSQVRTFRLIMVLIFFHTFSMKTKKCVITNNVDHKCHSNSLDRCFSNMVDDNRHDSKSFQDLPGRIS